MQARQLSPSCATLYLEVRRRHRPDPDFGDGRAGGWSPTCSTKQFGDAIAWLALLQSRSPWSSAAQNLAGPVAFTVNRCTTKFVASRRRAAGSAGLRAGVDIAEVCHGTVGHRRHREASRHQMLSETFDRVIVLEKDGPHRRRGQAGRGTGCTT